MSLLAALGACLLACAFWSIAHAAALRRTLAPGTFPAVALVAAAFVGADAPSLAAIPAVCGALAAGAIDARTGVIPDPLNAATALLALAFAATQTSLASSLYGALVAGITLLLLHVVTAGRGLGLGDVKLAAAIGAGLGPGGGIAAIACAFVLGGVVASWLLATRRAQRGGTVRFGPFLAAGACCAALVPAGVPW